MAKKKPNPFPPKSDKPDGKDAGKPAKGKPPMKGKPGKGKGMKGKGAC